MDSQGYKFCTSCGMKITGDAQFCPNCGNKAQGVVNETKDYQQSAEVPRSQSNTAPPVNNAQKHAFTSITKERIQKEFFSYHGRLNRLAYFKRVMVVIACICVLCVIAAMLEEAGARADKVELKFYIGMIPCVLSSIMLGIRRCHDLDRTGWFIGLTYIPYVGVIVALYIFFAEGTKGENTYGSDPLTDRY